VRLFSISAGYFPLAGRAEPIFQRIRLPLFLATFSLAYFLAAKLGIATSMPPEGIVILWPPNAILLPFLLSAKQKTWWLFLLVTVATEVAADVPAYPILAAVGYGIVNFSEVALAAALLRFGARISRLISLRDFVLFLLIGPLFSSGIAALFGAAIYKIGSPNLDYWHYWQVFWFGDALGLLVVGTALIAWKRPASWQDRSTVHVAIEGAALTLGLLVALIWVFSATSDLPRVYLIFPFLLWAALRFGIQGASGAVLATVGIAVWFTTKGSGPFAGLSNVDTVLSLQGLIVAVALLTFLLAFSTEDVIEATRRLKKEIAEHTSTAGKLKSAFNELRQVNTKLDQIVEQRTRELRTAVGRNELLLRELYHRIKNNLQLVSSIIAVHTRSVSEPSLQTKLAEVQGQIQAIATTYDVLQQQTESTDETDFCQVLRTLCRNIGDAGGRIISVETSTQEAPVAPDTAVALSLALNELITNAIKHGPPDGTIFVTCRRNGERMVITVADAGPGFPPYFDVTRAEGFGMRMVQSVLKQAKAEIQFGRPGNRAVVAVSVPLSREVS
jgi:two-component sensor histidine kinase/integral membrane sensor domain MASE1